MHAIRTNCTSSLILFSNHIYDHFLFLFQINFSINRIALKFECHVLNTFSLLFFVYPIGWGRMEYCSSVTCEVIHPLRIESHLIHVSRLLNTCRCNDLSAPCLSLFTKWTRVTSTSTFTSKLLLLPLLLLSQWPGFAYILAFLFYFICVVVVVVVVVHNMAPSIILFLPLQFTSLTYLRFPGPAPILADNDNNKTNEEQ